MVKVEDLLKEGDELIKIKKLGKGLSYAAHVKLADGRYKIYTVNNEPSMTDQSYKEDADANEIMRKYANTGIISHVSQIQGRFEDVSDIPGLLQGMERIAEAKEDFLKIPAEIRKKFDNDVSKFYSYVVDPANSEQLIEMGLKVRPPQPDPPKEPPKAAATKGEQDGAIV